MNDPRTLVSHPPKLQSPPVVPPFQDGWRGAQEPLERGLSFFADVRAGEGISVLLLTCTVFLLLASYYLLKTAREALDPEHRQRRGLEGVFVCGPGRPAAWRGPGLQLAGLAHAARAPHRPDQRLSRRQPAGVFALYAAGTVIAVPFYIWLGIYNVFTISQFWAFTNDLYTEGQGRRLFAFIGVGSSLGAWLGAEAAALLVKRTTAEPGR